MEYYFYLLSIMYKRNHSWQPRILNENASRFWSQNLLIFRYIQSNIISSKLYRINNNLPSWLHDQPKKYIKHCSEKLTLAKEILKDQKITTENKKFAVPSVTSKDAKYNVFYRDKDSYPDWDCVKWKKKLMPCKHMFAVMENINGISWDSFCPQYKNSVFFKIDFEAIGIKETVFTKKMTNLEHYNDTSTIPDVPEMFPKIPLPAYRKHSKAT